MIKTDYKPKKIKNPIFSEKKGSMTPIIMAGLALALVIIGISSQISDSPDQPEAVVIPLEDSVLESHNEADKEAEKAPVKRHEIPLNLGVESETEEETPEASDNKLSAVTKQSSQSEVEEALVEPWQIHKVKNGDSMARIFSRHNLSPADLHAIVQLGDATNILTKIKVGREYEYLLDAEQKLKGLRYHINTLDTLEVSRSANGWQAETLSKPVETRQASTSGVIESSLFLAGKKAGMTDALVMELANIFGWDIDFILDIREGDRFTLLYEEQYVEGEKYGNGDILAAEFINQGDTYRAVRYVDSKGDAQYYTPEGLSMRKAFLRAPLDFSYISSGFKPKRFHPILRRVKAHNGVDYRAPKGTPVKAAGDGTVIESAYNKYNGHYVFIQHGQNYVTKYLHFTKRKVKKGQKVKQGQIIGTVGATGLAEAPHLHYEFLVNGVHRNPRTVKLPDAEPVAQSERQRFHHHTSSLLAQLDKRKKASQVDLLVAE